MTEQPFIGPAHEQEHEHEHMSEPPRRRRRRNWLMIGLAAATAVILVGLAIAVPHAVEAYRVATLPTLERVTVHEVRSDHTPDEVDYESGPAPGGPHDPEWHDCGVYDEPVREENVEHSLEHGTVWITYDPDELSGSEVDELADQLPQKGILSPYPGQDAPVVLTVWERQLDLDGADDERIGLFLTEYGDGHTAPEPMASCAGGVQRLESEDEGPDGVNV